MKKLRDNVYLSYVILSSGMATAFYRSIYNTLLLFILSAIFLFIYERKLSKNYLVACLLWFIYITFSLVKYQGENYFWPFLYFVNFTIVYALIKHYGDSMFYKAENIIFFLCCVSLVFFSWQLINFNSILGYWKAFDLSGNFIDTKNLHYYHSFFYTIIQFVYLQDGSLPRNAGFCWEPGPFSCFIAIGIFCLMIKNNFNLKQSLPRLTIYVVALLTTQSTTGILAFLVLIIWYLNNRYKIKYIKVLGFPIIITIFVLLYFNVSFLGKKIDSQFNSNLYEMAMQSSNSEYGTNLDRFNSLKVTFIEFIDNPLIGIGADPDARWAAKNNINVNPTSGIGNILAVYGLFGIIPFFVLLYKSSNRFTSLFEYEGKWYFLMIIVIFGFSFNIIETPFFLALIMFSYFFMTQSGVNLKISKQIKDFDDRDRIHNI